MKYLPIIGMEIHVEPKTKLKMFCSCPADHFGKPANSQTCPVCLGLPGALPVPNFVAIKSCIKLGLALNTRINLKSKFDRKNYFYPDLPKGYQISQYDIPFCSNGTFTYIPPSPKTIAKKIAITRIHMEEDTGKLQHQKGKSLIDFNRSGVPLIEIVTEPELHSPQEMTTFLKELVKLIKWQDISDCDMEKGSLRLEANISVTEVSNPHKLILPSYKVEIKNVNSFKFLEKAVEFEIERQTKIIRNNQTPLQETRGYDETKNKTFSQRTKETAQDYRYFPEPDVPPVILTQVQINKLKSKLEVNPIKSMLKLTEQYQIRPDYAQILTADKNIYKQIIKLLSILPKKIKTSDIIQFIINQKIKLINNQPQKIIKKYQSSIPNYKVSKEQLTEIINQIIMENPNPVQQYKTGKTQVIGYLIGLVAKQTKGQADPKKVRTQLIKLLK